MAMEIPLRYLAALRMKRITRAQDLRLEIPDIVRIGFVSTFYGLFLPGSVSGGGITWFKFCSIDRKPTEVLLSIIYNRSVETAAVFAFGLLFWLLDPLANAHSEAAWLMTAALIALVAGYALAFSKPGSFIRPRRPSNNSRHSKRGPRRHRMSRSRRRMMRNRVSESA